MEIRIYDADLDLKGIIENQTSLIWDRKYFEPGSFELHVPITDYTLSVLKPGYLVTMKGQDDAGIIEDLQREQSNEKTEITAQGRFLSAYMGRRLIYGTVNLDTTVELAMRQLIEQAAPIPLLEMGEINGFEETVCGQVRYKNLLEFMTTLAKAGNIGYRFRPDFNAKKIIFECYVGLDRSIAQTVNNRVIFSETYDNIATAYYQYNDQAYYNVAYVIGKDSNENEVLRIVGDTESEGLERREVFVDASGVSDTDLTTSEWYAALDQEGHNALNNDVITESFECDTYSEGNFVYQVNYDLGDIVTVRKKDWDMQDNLRITEIQETYEYGALTVTPTLGTPLPTAINWED